MIVDGLMDWENTLNGLEFLWDEFKITIGEFWDSLKAKANSTINYVMSKIQPLLDAVKKLTDFVGITGGQTELDAIEAATSAHENSKKLLPPGQYSEEVPNFGVNQPGQTPVLTSPRNGQTVNSTNNITINATTNATASDIAKTVNTELDKRNRLPSRVNNGALIGDPK